MGEYALWFIGMMLVPVPFIPAAGREWHGLFGRLFLRLPGLRDMRANGWAIWIVYWNGMILVLFIAAIPLEWAFFIDFMRRCDDHCFCDKETRVETSTRKKGM